MPRGKGTSRRKREKDTISTSANSGGGRPSIRRTEECVRSPRSVTKPSNVALKRKRAIARELQPGHQGGLRRSQNVGGGKKSTGDMKKKDWCEHARGYLAKKVPGTRLKRPGLRMKHRGQNAIMITCVPRKNGVSPPVCTEIHTSPLEKKAPEERCTIVYKYKLKKGGPIGQSSSKRQPQKKEISTTRGWEKRIAVGKSSINSRRGLR